MSEILQPLYARLRDALRGDILAEQGKADEARAAYDEALKHFDATRKAEGLPAGPYREILQTKRDAGGAA